MMKPVLRIDGSNASPVHGRPVLDLGKAAWNWSMLAGALILGPLTFSPGAFLMFLILTYFSLLIGHSAGMHRMMIHKTYKSPKWLERTLIYIGVLVGMAGPFGILRIHDLRDWAQRQSECHDFFSHKRYYFYDLFWQLGYRFDFDEPPKFTIEPELCDDKWYQFLDKTWRWHQVVVAVPLYMMGGWPWVVWGIFVRVSVSVVGSLDYHVFLSQPRSRQMARQGCICTGVKYTRTWNYYVR